MGKIATWLYYQLHQRGAVSPFSWRDNCCGLWSHCRGLQSWPVENEIVSRAQKWRFTTYYSLLMYLYTFSFTVLGWTVEVSRFYWAFCPWGLESKIACTQCIPINTYMNNCPLFCGIQVTPKANFHFMHVLWIIKFFCICICFTIKTVHSIT